MGKKEFKENYLSRLFNVIDLPLFLLLGLALITQVISTQSITQSFYFKYAIYLGIGSFLLNSFLYGFSGFRAAKEKALGIKSWLAGLSTALIVGIFSLILSVIILVYFPTPIDTSMFTNSEVSVEEDLDSEFAGEEINNEEMIFEDESFEKMGQGGWSDPLLKWTLIGGAISLLFSSLWGALCGFIGGVIGRD